VPPYIIIYQRLIQGYEDSPFSKFWEWWPQSFETKEQAEAFAAEYVERGPLFYGGEGRDAEDVSERTITYSRVVDLEEFSPEHHVRKAIEGRE
jgi:hypothetical protein